MGQNEKLEAHTDSSFRDCKNSTLTEGKVYRN